MAVYLPLLSLTIIISHRCDPLTNCPIDSSNFSPTFEFLRIIILLLSHVTRWLSSIDRNCQIAPGIQRLASDEFLRDSRAQFYRNSHYRGPFRYSLLFLSVSRLLSCLDVQFLSRFLFASRARTVWRHGARQVSTLVEPVWLKTGSDTRRSYSGSPGSRSPQEVRVWENGIRID